MATTPNEDPSIPDSTQKRISDTPEPADQNPGWIEKLAQRSTGLPTNAEKPEPKSPSPWRYAGLGAQFGGTIVFFILMGWALDRQMNWSPWGLMTMTLLGLVGSLYLLIKEAMKENSPPPPKTGRKK